MIIGYFTNEFPNMNPETRCETGTHYGGGVGSVVFNLSIQMAKRGHEVHVFSTSSIGFESEEHYGRIHIHRYKPNISIGAAQISMHHLVEPFITNIELDVAHSHIGNLPAPIGGLIYSKKNKIPLIITHHGDWLGGHGSLSRRFCVFIYNNLLCDALLSMSDRIISLSNSHLANSKWLRKYRDKVVVIPNGVDLEDFNHAMMKASYRNQLGLPTDKKIVLFVGSLTARKGPTLLIKAMKKVVLKNPDAILVIVGSGHQETMIQEEIGRLDLSNHVLPVGSVTEAQKIAYYASADVFALPSYAEAFPLSILEASAACLPIVATDVGGVRDIVEDGVNGLMVKVGNCDDLAEKISVLLDNNDMRNAMGKMSRELVAQYSWDVVSEKTEALYLSTMNGNYWHT